MLNTMATRIMRLARGTALALGAAVMLAMILGTATTALAGKNKEGAALKLNVQNAVSAVTSMAGSVAEPVLRLDNNGAGPALDLQVGPSTTAPADKTVAPMRVDRPGSRTSTPTNSTARTPPSS